jgi:5'-3' exonuclease
MRAETCGSIVFVTSVWIAFAIHGCSMQNLKNVVECQAKVNNATAELVLSIESREQSFQERKQFEDQLRQAAIEELQQRVRKLEENGKLICD